MGLTHMRTKAHIEVSGYPISTACINNQAHRATVVHTLET